MKPTIAIAMSGGIDSLVSAYILKKEGYPVFGIHFVTGFETSDPRIVSDPLTPMASQLGIPIHRVDLSRLFRKGVVDYFVQTYLKGQTPNPCLICNPEIKFGGLLKAARQMGAELLATGHYARVDRTDSGDYRLLKGVDTEKDQSYFLAFLSQAQLSKACFPLGEMTKDAVKEVAKKNGLVPAVTDESQDVCFIRNKRYADFLQEYGNLMPVSGPIVTVQGETVGRHNGLYLFTVGQRRGINCPSSEPYYVIRLEPGTNSLVVGRKSDLESTCCTVTKINWMISPGKEPLSVDVRIRYRHSAVPAALIPQESGAATVRFNSPQKALTPGQGAVFYIDDAVVAAGIIS